MSFDSSLIANTVLMRAFDDDINVSPMKLQKILYFAAAQYAKRAHAPLLAEQFQPWQYGPVLRSVYSEFKPFESRPIRKYAKNARGQAFVVDEDQVPELQVTLDEVWLATRGHEAFQLSRITHKEGSAWWNAWQRYDTYIRDEELENDTTYLEPLGLEVPSR